MFKIVLMSFCLTFTCLFASENSFNENSSQLGRYQFTIDKKGHYIYLLDTETGRMWMTRRTYRDEIQRWVKFPPLPTAIDSWVESSSLPAAAE